MKIKALFTSLLIISLGLTQMSAQENSEFNLDRYYKLAADGTVHLNTSDANIKITGSDRSDVHLDVQRKETVRGIRSRKSNFDMEVEERGGDLYINERTGRGGVTFQIGSRRIDYEIEIEMPMTGSLRIKGDDDDYVIRSVNGDISIKTDDGDIDLLDCTGDDFDIEIEDGDLKMDGGKGAIYVKIDDGDIDIRNGSFDRMELDAEDGSVSVETSLSDRGDYELVADDANVDFVVLGGGGEFNVSKDDGRISASSAYDTVQESERRSRFELKGGEARVEIRIEDGRVRLSTSK
ncbi:DUF4097 family beta strand repeat-containing protein [Roseivirga misakiensis]|uniref:DUF4097 domain-containing protein n=1 Tax=Roseivirga misakiensis TaxID=1563681 RepID=A0A1E5T4K7_9BACT|nr:DUF4097 family beta strand repeat-containing protein [Roseivirga misakiensis]OEK06312.1 hypothetical protein BFP71_01145 [Roseivirga misakiensis]